MTFTYVALQRVGGYRLADGSVAPAKLRATPYVPMVNGAEIVDREVVLPFDSSGTTTGTIAATTDPGTTPSGNAYRFAVDIRGQVVHSFIAALPHNSGSPVDISTLTPLIDPPTFPAGYQPLDADLTAIAALGDGNPHRVSGTWSARSDAALASALGVAAGGGAALNDRGPVGASTAYSPGDVVSYRGRRIYITNATTSNSSAFISSANYTIVDYGTVVDIRDYGAAVDGVTDDTTAVRAAIASFATSGTSDPGTGGTVYFPPGYTMISGTLDLPSNVHLRGAGRAATVIQLLPNSNCHMITTHRSTGSGNSNAFWSSVRDLMLDGRRANQGAVLSDVTMRPGYTTLTSAGGTFAANGTLITGIGLLSGTTIVSGGGTNTVVISQAPIISALQQAPGAGLVYQGGTTDLAGNPIPWCGIYHETNPYNSAQSGDTQFDPTHVFENLRIYFMQGDGIRVHGRSDVSIRHVKVSFATGNGFTVDFDTSVTDCITEKAHAHGIEVPGHSADRINGNKFYNSYGAGIYLHNGSGEITLAGNISEECNWDGVRLESQVGVQFSGVVSEAGFSNALGGTPRQATWAPSTAYGNFRAGPTAHIVVPTTPNGHVYACYVAGTSGGSEPTWPTTNGNTVVDGGVTWVCLANAPASISLINSTNCVIDAVAQSDLNGLRITGTSTGNAIRLGHTTGGITGSVDVSSDSISLTGSTTNAVVVNGAVLTGATGGGGTITPRAAVARRTSGNLSLGNTSWTSVDTAMDLTLAAAAGDWLEVSLSGLITDENANRLYMDAVTLVSGAAVNAVSGQSVSASRYGVPGWSMSSAYKGPLGGTVLYQVQAGDVSGGNVTLRLQYANDNTTARTLSATTGASGWPLIFGAKIVH